MSNEGGLMLNDYLRNGMSNEQIISQTRQWILDVVIASAATVGFGYVPDKSPPAAPLGAGLPHTTDVPL